MPTILKAKTVKAEVKGFFDGRTGSIQYVVADPATKHCALVDPVLDFDEKSGTTGTMSADAILSYVAAKDLTVQWILDTHPHADHLSAAHYLQRRTGAAMAIGARVVDMQRLWKSIYNWKSLATDGSQWDRLFAHGESFEVASIPARVLFSPGHTPASITYLIGDAAFVNDTLFMPDGGTARADFPGGDAEALWASIQDILALPPATRVFTGRRCHRGYAVWSTGPERTIPLAPGNRAGDPKAHGRILARRPGDPDHERGRYRHMTRFGVASTSATGSLARMRQLTSAWWRLGCKNRAPEGCHRQRRRDGHRPRVRRRRPTASTR